MKGTDRCFIRKHGQYKEISYEELLKRKEADALYREKQFIPLHGMLLEVPPEDYAAFYRDRRRQKYLREEAIRHREFSYDMLDTDEFLGADIIADDSVDIISLVEKAVLSETLSDCLDKLSNEEQALLSEYYVYQMPEAELAERYGVNQSTICRRIQRAVAKLKKSMKI